MILSAATRPPHPRPHRVGLLSGAALLALAACATGLPLEETVRRPPLLPAFHFGEDTFAFPNIVRALNQGRPDLYANYCFVLTRGVVQFFKFASFEPDQPRLSPPAYTELVRQVTARAPWEDAPPILQRVAIPGYRNLHEFSREQEAAVKAGLNARLWTWLHWTIWRVILPVSGEHQEGVAAEVLADLQAGLPVQLLVTNWPITELNHGVVAYAYRFTEGDVEFTVYDPNEPERPGSIRFRRGPQHFWATHLFNTWPGKIRAFRMYYSPIL